MNRVLLSVFALAGLSACSASTDLAISADAAKLKSEVSSAVNAYGIAKGIAGVATLADPALIPIVTAAEAALDPMVQTATVAQAASAADVAQLTALVQQIEAQVVALETQTAAAIKVVPSVVSAAK